MFRSIDWPAYPELRRVTTRSVIVPSVYPVGRGYLEDLDIPVDPFPADAHGIYGRMLRYEVRGHIRQLIRTRACIVRAVRYEHHGGHGQVPELAGGLSECARDIRRGPGRVQLNDIRDPFGSIGEPVGPQPEPGGEFLEQSIVPEPALYRFHAGKALRAVLDAHTPGVVEQQQDETPAGARPRTLR